MEIRRLRPEEFEEAGRVTALAYYEVADFDDPDWVRYLGEIADVAGRASHTIVLGAVDGGRVLGTATVEHDDQVVGDDDPPFGQEMANLRMLGVDPAARGRGVGRALVEAAMSEVRRLGKRVFVLHTTQRMTVAQHMYQTLGFRPDPSREHVFDNGFRLLAYRLDLEG
jgi:ribosomal protein S18 acetylase RimI-like enzyme